MTDQGDLRERLVGIICDAIKAQEPDGAIIHFSPPARDDRSAIIDGEIDLDAVADALLAFGLMMAQQRTPEGCHIACDKCSWRVVDVSARMVKAVNSENIAICRDHTCPLRTGAPDNG